MSGDQVDHLHNLRKLREILVEERRTLVATALGQNRAERKSYVSGMVDRQNEIEALDRAIAEEIELQGRDTTASQ